MEIEDPRSLTELWTEVQETCVLAHHLLEFCGPGKAASPSRTSLSSWEGGETKVGLSKVPAASEASRKLSGLPSVRLHLALEKRNTGHRSGQVNNQAHLRKQSFVFYLKVHKHSKGHSPQARKSPEMKVGERRKKKKKRKKKVEAVGGGEGSDCTLR